MAARESAAVLAALADVAAGMSQRDAVIKHGVTASAIWRARHRRGATDRLPKGKRLKVAPDPVGTPVRETPQVLAALVDIDAGMPQAEAARRHDVSVSALVRARARRGMPALRQAPKPPLPKPEPYYFGDGTPLVPGAPGTATPCAAE